MTKRELRVLEHEKYRRFLNHGYEPCISGYSHRAAYLSIRIKYAGWNI